jgi:hypothetical protein
MDLDRTADLARMLVRQGLVAEAMDALESVAAEAPLPVVVDQDDQDRVTLEVDFDPVLVERLQRVPTATRDREAGLWRVGPGGLVALVDLLERLALPPCAPDVGCVLGDEGAPSSLHRDAHERCCGP